MNVSAATFGASSQICTGSVHFAAIIAVPNGNTVTPPNLARDTPIADIFHPAGISFGETFRNEFGATIFNAVNSSFYQGFHFYKPLGRYQRLYYTTATLAVTNSVSVVFNFYKRANFFQLFQQVFTTFVTFLTSVLTSFFSHQAVHANNNDAGKFMTDTHFIVVGVVCRSNFYSAGTKFQIYIAICNNGNDAFSNGQAQMLANQMTITGVFRINCYCSIAQHGFRTSGSNGQESTFFFHNRVLDIPQVTCVILMFYFDITQSGVTVNAPVGNTGTFVNQAFFVQGAEHFAYSLRAAFIHSKAFAFPIAGNAQAFQLVDDAVAILVLPFPNTFQEFFTTKIIAGFIFFFFNYFFYFNLGSQACMVIAGHPQGIVTHHAVPTNQNILQGVVQSVTHMQLTGDIRRGNYDAECFFTFLYFCMKITIVFPIFIPFLLNGSGVVNLRDVVFFTHVYTPLTKTL